MQAIVWQAGQIAETLETTLYLASSAEMQLISCRSTSQHEPVGLVGKNGTEKLQLEIASNCAIKGVSTR